jgi:succinyl-diaminopimelate desuccinylase
MNVILLTRKLLSFNTVNPPGNEEEIAKFVGAILAGEGFKIEYPVLESNRPHLIAEKGLSSVKSPIVLSGHFDTVPLGNKSWRVDPFAGKVIDGKIYGRGSSDMKGGLAAMILASIEAFSEVPPEGGIRLIFSADEEYGCRGISKLVRENRGLGNACAIVVGEPTANMPVTSHKGAIFLKAVTSGKTAHSSMPELGINAIYKAARSITRIADLDFEAEPDPLLGSSTISVGTINGGLNINSVPDRTEFTIDIRTTSKTVHSSVINKLRRLLGDETAIEKLVDVHPLCNSEDDPFVQMVYEVCDVVRRDYPKTLSYLTDGAVLQKLYNNAPTVILGPGQPEMAHQTDEFCHLDKLHQAVNIYKNIISKWG